MHEDPTPDTVIEAIAALRADGYTADYVLVDGVLSAEPDCPTCAVGHAVVERLYRFEGDSDPGDEMIVFGLLDPASGTRGTLASAFGVNADPALSHHLVDLHRRFEP